MPSKSKMDRNYKRYLAELYANEARGCFASNDLDLFSMDSDNDKKKSETNKEDVICKLAKIVQKFRGKLERDEEGSGTRIKKTAREGFTIYYKEPIDYLDVLYELGHAFLDLNKMRVGDVKYCGGADDFDGTVGLFARSFAMPRKDFERIAIEFNKDVDRIARYFDIDYFQAYQRGIDIDIWI